MVCSLIVEKRKENVHVNLKTVGQLFFNMLYISAFTFGGGFVIVTFMKKIFVDRLHWLEEEEMLDMTALAQSSPGAIAVNAAILVGWKAGGAVGMAVAVLGTIIPPLVILSVLSFFYGAFAANRYVKLVLMGMQAGVAAVILDVVCSMGLKLVKQRNLLFIAVMCLAFVAVFFFKVNVVVIILSAVLIGILVEMLNHRKAVSR